VLVYAFQFAKEAGWKIKKFLPKRQKIFIHKEGEMRKSVICGLLCALFLVGAFITAIVLRDRGEIGMLPLKKIAAVLVPLILGCVFALGVSLFEKKERALKKHFGGLPTDLPKSERWKYTKLNQLRADGVLEVLAKQLDDAINSENVFFEQDHLQEPAKTVNDRMVAYSNTIRGKKKDFWFYHKLFRNVGIKVRESYKDYLKNISTEELEPSKNKSSQNEEIVAPEPSHQEGRAEWLGRRIKELVGR
jgi:hypothetical protein